MGSNPETAHVPKVCMLSYYDSPGALPPMLNAGRSLAGSGFEVEALCVSSSGDASGPDELAPGFTTRALPLRTRRVFHALFGHAPRNRAVAAVQYALSYAEYVVRTTANAIRSGASLYEANDLPTLLPALLAGRWRRRPVVYRAHEIWSETHAKVRFAAFWRWLDRRLVPRCDAVVTPDENRSRIYREEYGAQREPLTVRNCPPFRPPIASTRLRDELTRRGVRFTSIVLYQGLVDSMRCIEEIAAASRHFDEGAVLVVLGGGYGRWADPAAALAAYDRVVVLPRVPYAELPPLTASADMGILLYRNDCRNNFYCAPNKLFEYMMMGLPVIAADFPGMRSIVEGEAVGACVDPEDPMAIARAVNRISGDEATRSRFRENALRVSVQRYNWERESVPLLARYRELCGIPGAGA
jgi:glycosyltransferase involved in cell wall biosynthesis